MNRRSKQCKQYRCKKEGKKKTQRKEMDPKDQNKIRDTRKKQRAN